MTPPRTIAYCRTCAAAVQYRIPDDGDTRERAVCPACQTIHYENPLNVVGTIPVLADGRVLLCLRNIEPRRGKWTLPAGFMELCETTADGAMRETHEEAGADIRMGPLFSVVNVPYVGQVHLFYRAEVLSETLNPGHETQEARFFAEHEIPWDTLAFRTVETTLRHYFSDANAGRLVHNPVHCLDLAAMPPIANNVMKK
jgi:ADP-ribose pyrophosphatase YjhB (NUDIX family)